MESALSDTPICRGCGQPKRKQVYKAVSRKQHPWGLTVWRSRWVCSKTAVCNDLDCMVVTSWQCVFLEELMQPQKTFIRVGSSMTAKYCEPIPIKFGE